MIKKSSDKILSVMDPVCLHHDMSGLGVGRSGRVGGGGVQVESMEELG